MIDIKELIAGRNTTHGDFTENAEFFVGVLTILRGIKSPRTLQATEILALQMIVAKLARAISSTTYHADNWVDIGGYSDLVPDLDHGKDSFTFHKEREAEVLLATSKYSSLMQDLIVKKSAAGEDDHSELYMVLNILLSICSLVASSNKKVWFRLIRDASLKFVNTHKVKDVSPAELNIYNLSRGQLRIGQKAIALKGGFRACLS